jgi:hypothetical protein
LRLLKRLLSVTCRFLKTLFMTEEKLEINCAEACVNGCVLGDRCPNLKYVKAASKFIDDTPLDRMLEIAQESLPDRILKSSKFVLPEDN